jgi:hypothetical protein
MATCAAGSVEDAKRKILAHFELLEKTSGLWRPKRLRQAGLQESPRSQAMAHKSSLSAGPARYPGTNSIWSAFGLHIGLHLVCTLVYIWFAHWSASHEVVTHTCKPCIWFANWFARRRCHFGRINLDAYVADRYVYQIGLHLVCKLVCIWFALHGGVTHACKQTKSRLPAECFLYPDHPRKDGRRP